MRKVYISGFNEYLSMKNKDKLKWENLEKSIEEIRNDPVAMKLLDKLIKFHTS